MKIYVQYQNQFYKWLPYGSFHTELNAYTIATARAKATKKRFRLVDEKNNLIDLIEPN